MSLIDVVFCRVFPVGFLGLNVVESLFQVYYLKKCCFLRQGFGVFMGFYDRFIGFLAGFLFFKKKYIYI